MYKIGRKPSLDAPESWPPVIIDAELHNSVSLIAKELFPLAIAEHQNSVGHIICLDVVQKVSRFFTAVFIKGMQRDKNNCQSAKNNGLRKA